MHITSLTFLFAFPLATVALRSRPHRIARQISAVPVALIPEFGVVAGQSPDGTGNCVGINGIAIPCTCPPDRNLFITDLNINVAAGRPVNNSEAAPISFPLTNSQADVLARLNAATETLQNLFGSGVGCPQASTTFGAQVAAAQADVVVSSTAAAASSAPAAASPVAATVSSTLPISLIPDFGIVAGQNPDGTGNCEGVNGIAIPCSCPPDRNLFITDININVVAGFPVNNTQAAPISFPLGATKGEVLARLNAATETLQNLFGAGVGCPQASTTFGAQVAAANALAA